MLRGLCCPAHRYAVLSVMLLILSQAFSARGQANLLTNGGFEVDPDGHSIPDNGPTYSDWRHVGLATGGVGAVTVRAAAASVGSVGVEIAHTSGAFWIDRWETGAPIISKPGVYLLLADVKDGGVYGGQDAVNLTAVIHNNNATYPEFGYTCTPGANFETFGTLAPVTTLGDMIDARLTPSGTANQSFLADNVRLYDVTNGNRVINGGFENSATRVLNWRTYSLTPGEFQSSLSTDAHTGARSLLINRTGSSSGGAVDLWDEGVIPTTGGDRMQFNFWAKKVSGDAASRLIVMIQEYDANNVWLGLQHLTQFHPDATGFQRGSMQVTLNASTAKVSLAFMCGDNGNGVQYPGSYLIDDVAFARTSNQLLNGDFEFDIDGDDGVQYWREPWPSQVSAIARAAAASDGSTGAEIVQNAAVPGQNFVDRWSSLVTPLTLPGIYKITLDSKDGGTYGGTDWFQLFGVMHAAPYPPYGTTIDPDSAFETFGLTAPVAADRTGIDVRIVASSTPNQSFFIDNVRVTDVTNAERAINGGFENSATRLVNWRHFSLVPGEFTAALDADAYTGARALRIERIDTVNDGAVDLDSDRVAVLPGETLNVRMAAKKLSGNASVRLFVSIGQYDAAGAYLGPASQVNAAFEASSEYGVFSTPVVIDAGAAYLNIGLRVGNNIGADRAVGAYLVDDVSFQRNTAPSFSAAGLAFNGNDYTSIRVVTSGWSDTEGATEQYAYQWKLNGTAIPGATAPVLDRSVYGSPDTLTCVVTAYDGLLSGNSIETAVVPVELSSFDVE